MNPACLLGRHEWHQVPSPTRDNRTAQQCRRCGRTEEPGAEARNDRDPELHALSFVTGGRTWSVFGALVAALAAPVWTSMAAGPARLACALALVLVGYGLAAYRREIRVDRGTAKLIQRVRLLPFTVYRRELDTRQLRTLQLGWHRRPGSNGSGQQVLVTALGPHVTLTVTRQPRPRKARAIAADMAEVIGLAVDDRTREPGAPGT